MSSKYVLVTNPKPQLDEIHITGPNGDNHDVNPPRQSSYSSPQWREAWHNDYWGRPLTSPSSHKSWRPISVWSFRFLKGGTIGQYGIGKLAKFHVDLYTTACRMLPYFFDAGRRRVKATANNKNNEDEMSVIANELFAHRFVNVCIHATLVRLIGIISTLLFVTPKQYNNNRHKKKYSKRTRRRNDNAPSSTLLLQCTSYCAQILFAIHPAHVECVVNAANRPHILALLFNVIICDPSSISIIKMIVLAVMGLLSCETAIFHYPAIVITMTTIQHRELLLQQQVKTLEETKDSNENRSNLSSSNDDKIMITTTTTTKDSSIILLSRTIIELLPRYICLLLLSIIYLLYRKYCNDSLSIPIGLIRPAENPYYDAIYNKQPGWDTITRIINYSYIVGIHIAKSFGIEIIGYSHEYGYDCIPEIKSSFFDVRLVLPIGIILLFVTAAIWSWYGYNYSFDDNNETLLGRGRDQTYCVLPYLVLVLWMATLFPIAGIIKVGTFVSDRIVVASTFGTCIFVGRAFALCIVGSIDNDDGDDNYKDVGSAAGLTTGSSTNKQRGTATSTTIAKYTRMMSSLIFFVLCSFNLARRTIRRSSEWMDCVPLFESSIKACPRSIKSNLEMSKLFSGLIPHMTDLDKALSLIHTAQSIDPTYCDVHYQYAHVYIQQMKYIPFEEELVEALQCQFTMGQAMNMWNQYWPILLRNDGNVDNNKIGASVRYHKYMTKIREVISKAEEEEESERTKSIIGGSRISSSTTEGSGEL